MADSDQYEVTRELARESAPPGDAPPGKPPEQIGRYRIEKLLGKGGFGLVYLAHDDQLDRPVAVKVPHARLISQPRDAEAYLAEARTVANLDHSNIVPVHDVGSTQECPCYVVSKYVEGTDLATMVKESRPSYTESAELVATVAEALHYAHKQGLVHRDVKPGNILIGNDGKPYVVDFGLALREENIGKGPKYAGTPAYMSPEQARGEGHRVDGRSDIFSLGVVFYELLVGRKPFRGETRAELLEQVTSYEPRPLRQYDEKLPKELERICHKAMGKRARERYSSAYDMAEDLRQFLAEQTVIQSGASPGGVASFATETQASAPASTSVGSNVASSASIGLGSSSDSQPIMIVPKGLRSFDAHDADFFLELLPGPRDRNGLPDSLRFWKIRIEESDSGTTFSIGLIYGPSGCGKSSLVKAGLLPRLSDDVVPVCIESTSVETEMRLLHGLRKRCPAVEDNLNLQDTLAALRRGQGIPVGKKVLIVLDQFEQWLHANKEEEDTDLVQALRQCDGGRLQCIVMVRDDFWLAVSRFMRDSEVRLLEGDNIALVDLFDLDHARKVLAAFGRAFGKLPMNLLETTREQKDFLKQSVTGLAEEGRVICVRLALFAEMMKRKAWTPAILRAVGGTKGIGVTFLEETFSSSAASPEHRYHQKAARAVLKDLLPDAGTDIKGYMRSYTELLAASGYGSRPKDFEDLVRILDSEIRLITPTDPEGIETQDFAPQSGSSQKYYQLTHDYLVHSLRDWLTYKQRETRRGRTEMRLDELAVAWNAQPEHRHLPSVVEWLNISLLTRRRRQTEPQRRMMRSASWLHSFRWGAVLVIVLAGMFALHRYVSHVQQQNLITLTAGAVDALETTTGVTVPFALRDLEKLPRGLVIAELRGRYGEADRPQKIAVAYALAELGEVDHEFLVASIRTAEVGECPNMVRALGNSSDVALQTLMDATVTADDSEDWTAKARMAVVALHLGESDPASDMLQCEERPDPIQRTVFIETFAKWHDSFDELADSLRDTNDQALRSGICLSVGGVEDASDATRRRWQEVFAQWYVNQPDAGTHSAAGWALRAWNLNLPEIAVSNRESEIDNWTITPSRLTMLRIRTGEFVWVTEGTDPKEQTVEMTQEFLLSDREITVRLFRQFVEDAEYDGEKPEDWEGVLEEISPGDENPVQRVSWYDALMFCNWLSYREGLNSCYERTGEKDRFERGGRKEEHDAWRLLRDAHGYRLPSEAQWEYACRAGTTTRYSCGQAEATLNRYGLHIGNSNSQTSPGGSKLCNAWGLFDMHGNVNEWCGGRYSDFPGTPPVYSNADPAVDLRRVSRGGSWRMAAQLARSSTRFLHQSNRVSFIGFRVARIP